MRIFTTKSRWLLMLVLFIGAVTTHAQKNRPLMEEYTGAWCGWCTDGEYNCRTISENNPDVIWVSVHNGDPMAIKEQDTLTAAYISGFPSCTFDRVPFGGAIASSDRTKWLGNVNARVAAPVQAGVTVTSTYDKNTRQVKATVSVNFLKNMTGNYGFTLYVVEDEITGGADYDQSNYLTGRQGFESSPYYTLPAKIKGFVHRFVLREVKGGVWGEQSVITANPMSGSTFSKEYTFTLNSKYNAANVSLVGYVSQFNSDKKNSPVINADKVDLMAGQRVKVDITTTDNYGKVPANATGFKTKLNVSNPTTGALTVNLAYDATNSTAPAGWTVKVSPSSVVVPAKGNVDVDLVIDSDNNGAFAKLHVTADPQVGAGIIGLQSSTDYYALAEATKSVVISGYTDDVVANGTYLAALKAKTKFANSCAILPGAADILSKFDLSKFELIILPIDYSHRGASGSAALATALNDAMNGGTRVIINSELDAWGVKTYATTSSETKDFYLNQFGITGTTESPIQRITTNSSGQITGVKSFSVRGIASDELGKLVGTFTTNTYNSSYPYFQYFTDAIELDPSGPGKAFATYETASQIAGVRAQTGTSRGIYLSFSPDVISSAAGRVALLGKLIDWVTDAIVVVPTPDIKILGTNGESVEFGNVEVKKSKTLSVSLKNSGNAELTITAMNVDADYADVLKWGTNLTFPIKIAAGATQEIPLVFTPMKIEEIITSCTIKSNAKSADVDGQNIFGIIANGIQSSSVDEGTSGDGIVSLSAAPNPTVNQQSTIRYSIHGSVSQLVHIQVVDALGNTVATLANTSMAPGSYTANFDATSLASGSYRVVLKAGSSSSFIPVVVAK